MVYSNDTVREKNSVHSSKGIDATFWMIFVNSSLEMSVALPDYDEKESLALLNRV